jgi:hypothetical protein
MTRSGEAAPVMIPNAASFEPKKQANSAQTAKDAKTACDAAFFARFGCNDLCW